LVHLKLTAGDSKQIELCIQCGLFDKLVHLVLHDEPDIRKEAIWAISNATAGCNDILMAEMVRRNIIQALGAALKYQEPRIIFVALEGLTNVLKSGAKLAVEGVSGNPYCLLAEQFGLVDNLEQLQMHNNEMVYKKTCEILTKYFEQEEEDDLNVLI
jgi:hypothetical protein